MDLRGAAPTSSPRGVVGGSPAFSSEQYEEAYPEGVERSFWHVARNAIVADEIEKTRLQRGRLLEIGCGRGIVVEYLRDRGFDCIGCDLAAPVVAPRLTGSVLPSTDFRRLPAELRATITGVLLCDVLEHLQDPGELLRDVVESHPAMTHVLVTVPARTELWSDWDVRYGHFRRYDLGTLVATLEGAGLKIQSAHYFFHALYAPMFLARGGRRGTKIEAPKRARLHRWLGKAFLLESRLVPSSIPGTSIIAVAAV
jgi:SAM-dependent methyltransferase